MRNLSYCFGSLCTAHHTSCSHSVGQQQKGATIIFIHINIQTCPAEGHSVLVFTTTPSRTDKPTNPLLSIPIFKPLLLMVCAVTLRAREFKTRRAENRTLDTEPVRVSVGSARPSDTWSHGFLSGVTALCTVHIHTLANQWITFSNISLTDFPGLIEIEERNPERGLLKWVMMKIWCDVIFCL